MKRTQFPTAPCSIARSLDVVGDWWTPLIVRECLYGVHRFSEMQKWLPISKNILAARLKQLVDQGVLEKRPYQDNPPRHEYHLTEQGYDAAKIVFAILNFGERWFFEDGREPIRLYDRETHRRIRPVLVDAETGEPIKAENLYSGPGPAFPESDEIRRERFQEFFAVHPDAGELHT